MLQLTFSDPEKQALHYERFHHPHPRIQQRMEVLWLKSQGIAHGQICRLVAITENTLRSYLRLYQAGGIEALREVPFAKPTSELDRYRGSLEAYFQQHPPRSVNEAAAIVEQQTGIRRSHEQVRQFLRRLGLRCRKVGMVPAKASPVAQKAFKKKSSSRVWSKPKKANEPSFSSMPRISYSPLF